MVLLHFQSDTSFVAAFKAIQPANRLRIIFVCITVLSQKEIFFSLTYSNTLTKTSMYSCGTVTDSATKKKEGIEKPCCGLVQSFNQNPGS